MKTKLITALLTILFVNAFSQNAKFEYTGRHAPSVNKEKLNAAKFVNDISPALWSTMWMSRKDKEEMDRIRKANYSLGYILNPDGGYETFINYVSVEISATCNGKPMSSTNTSAALSPEQKNILNTADLGTNISILIQFRFKNNNKNSFGDDAVSHGESRVTLVPEHEAEYSGGDKGITKYLQETIFDKLSNEKAIGYAKVKFTVDEQGTVTDVKLLGTSENLKTDNLIIDAFIKMPKWKPASNAKGIKLKQNFSILLGKESGC